MNSESFKNVFGETFTFRERILAEIGGEFEICGLFNTARDDEQYTNNGKQEKFSLYLDTSISEVESSISILQTTIIAKIPQHIILDIIDRFDSICIKDT